MSHTYKATNKGNKLKGYAANKAKRAVKSQRKQAKLLKSKRKHLINYA